MVNFSIYIRTLNWTVSGKNQILSKIYEYSFRHAEVLTLLFSACISFLTCPFQKIVVDCIANTLFQIMVNKNLMAGF